ncbi:DUF2911 domain-containing protein [Flavimarina sp. Hel_I_48]|uniref:DUF2911 domain-containing protein n=1 Tax=Flavimarina sp. Hel_I_48 TaxID=1392488 RepID=UPI0004DF6EC6|nr:DUF2911 domain-containing protein [Flavimarina sp. Hel_I_48]
MRKIFLLTIAILASFQMTAQINTPAPSPAATLTQVVGLTNVSVDYSRPSMKGREVFGKMLPYGTIWRTGANATTKFKIDKDITINGKALKAGTYSLYTVPGETDWDVVFYTDDSNPLITEFDNSKIVLRTTVESQDMPMNVETFTITVDDVTSDGATLGLLWANEYVGIPFKVNTDQEVMASIDAALNGPSAGDYYNAAVYYLNAGKDIEKSKMWMEKAMTMTENPRFWQLRQQSLILAKSGDKKEAIKAAKASLADAEKAGNADYIKMNKDSLKEWGAM